MGRHKTIVAIAPKLPVAVWQVFTTGRANCFVEAENVAHSLFGLACDVGVADLPGGPSAKSFAAEQLDRLGIGADLEVIPWGTKRVKLPRSRLRTPDG